MSGMAPTPDQLQRGRAIVEGNGSQSKRSKPMVEGDIPIDSPLFKSEISQLIHAISWTYQKRILDHVEILCHNEKQWETVRRIVMGIQTEQVEVLRQIIGQKVRDLQLKAKEQTDDRPDDSR